MALRDGALVPDGASSYYSTGLQDAALAEDTSGFQFPFNQFLQSLQGYGGFGLGSAADTGININDISAFKGGGIVPTDAGGSIGGAGTNVQGRGGLKGFFLGEDGQQSQFGNIAGLANDLAGTYLGFKNYGLAKDSLDFQKDSFNKQYAAQATAHNANRNQRFLNAELARGRGATGPSPYGTFEDYKARTNIQA